jgi:hypothetical protein
MIKPHSYTFGYVELQLQDFMLNPVWGFPSVDLWVSVFWNIYKGELINNYIFKIYLMASEVSRYHNFLKNVWQVGHANVTGLYELIKYVFPILERPLAFGWASLFAYISYIFPHLQCQFHIMLNVPHQSICIINNITLCGWLLLPI